MLTFLITERFRILSEIAGNLLETHYIYIFFFYPVTQILTVFLIIMGWSRAVARALEYEVKMCTYSTGQTDINLVDYLIRYLREAETGDVLCSLYVVNNCILKG